MHIWSTNRRRRSSRKFKKKNSILSRTLNFTASWSMRSRRRRPSLRRILRSTRKRLHSPAGELKSTFDIILDKSRKAKPLQFQRSQSSCWKWLTVSLAARNSPSKQSTRTLIWRWSSTAKTWWEISSKNMTSKSSTPSEKTTTPTSRRACCKSQPLQASNKAKWASQCELATWSRADYCEAQE